MDLDDFMVYLFCAHRDWALKLYKKICKKHKNIHLIKSPNNVILSKIKKINPKYIFFPDWSWIIPNEIINNYKCVCFHESDLPKFRGGSPLQNQIIRGITYTKTTAFFMNEEIDAGEIILQKKLSLKGTLNEIFDRMIINDYEIIEKIIQGKYKIRKQSGRPTTFKRRQPYQSELKSLDFSKRYLYDFIRMLDNPYPNAFLSIGKRKIIFHNVKLKNNRLKMEAEII